jgi:hypothetical protein
VRSFARSLLVVAAAAAATGAVVSSAQDGYVRGPDGTVTGVVGAGSGYGGVPAGIPKGPISITLERRSFQTLWDGTHITRVTHEVFTRDSKGRTRTETEFGPIPGTEVQNRNVLVNDPIAELTYIWQEGLPNARKVYTVRQTHSVRGALAPQAGSNSLMRTLPNAGQANGATAPLGSELAESTLLMAPPPPPPAPSPPVNLGLSQASALRPETTRDPLGERVVGGLTCSAQRTTTVYPVDYFGNDRPITTTDETCMSREAGRVIQQTRDDPRTGLQTVTLVSGNTAEPDASLFLPPADYTEQKPMTLPPKP